MRSAAMIAALALAATVSLSWSSGTGLHLQTVQHQVKAGETVWEIACKYMPQQAKTRDVRELVYDIREHNKLKNYVIHAGDIVEVPLWQKE